MAHPDRFLLAGVFGWPVMHSRSPLLHNFWFERHGLAGTYLPLAIRPEALAAALKGLHPLGFSGVNVTIPHKEKALTLLDEVDANARRIGAVSCIAVRPDGTLAGSNNDGFGFMASVAAEAPAWRPAAGPAIVIGAGGGARAIVGALADKGVPEIRLVNRTAARAHALADEFSGPIRPIAWQDRHRALAGVAMLVNTTSQGMVGQSPLDLDLAALSPEALVCDIVYVPRETPLLAAARARGNATINGLGMLLHQARPAWRAWFGIDPEVTAELRARIEATL
jgi:shikimate dehydrogenase